jgi:hypothetical protein
MHYILSNFPAGYKPCKMFEGAVVGRLGVCGKNAAGQLPAFKVIGNALTADSLLGAGRVSAGASFQIFFLFTLHAFSFAFFRLFTERPYWFPKPFCPPQSGHCHVIPLQDIPQKFSSMQSWQI